MFVVFQNKPIQQCINQFNYGASVGLYLKVETHETKYPIYFSEPPYLVSSQISHIKTEVIFFFMYCSVFIKSGRQSLDRQAQIGYKILLQARNYLLEKTLKTQIMLITVNVTLSIEKSYISLSLASCEVFHQVFISLTQSKYIICFGYLTAQSRNLVICLPYMFRNVNYSFYLDGCSHLK